MGCEWRSCAVIVEFEVPLPWLVDATTIFVAGATLTVVFWLLVLLMLLQVLLLVLALLLLPALDVTCRCSRPL